MKQYLEAGRITSTHGVKGMVKLEPWADSAEFITGFKTLYIDGRPVAALHSSVHKNMVLLTLKGVDDVNAAMKLKGKVVHINRADAKLPEGGFFIQDIIGAEVRDESGAVIGTLADVLELPSGNVYVVRGERGEHMIPAVPEFVLSTDVEAGKITVRLIEGM